MIGGESGPSTTVSLVFMQRAGKTEQDAINHCNYATHGTLGFCRGSSVKCRETKIEDKSFRVDG